MAYVWLDEYELAVADYSKAIELDPEDAWTYRARGRTYYWLDEYELAVADYSKAIELDLENPGNYVYRADIYDWLGEDEKAIADYRKVLTLTDDPSIRRIAEEGLIKLGAD